MSEQKGVPRLHEKVPFSDVEPLLNLLKNSMGIEETELLRTVGYSSNIANQEWRKEQKVPLRAKYALLGLAAELKLKMEQKPIRQFTFKELTLLFAVLSGMEFSVDEGDRRALVAKIAAELAH